MSVFTKVSRYSIVPNAQNPNHEIPSAITLLKYTQEAMCTRITLLACWLTTIAVAVWIITSWHRLAPTRYVGHLTFVAALWLLYAMRYRIALNIRAWVIIVCINLLAINNLISFGIYSDGRILLLIAILTAVGLRGLKASSWVLGCNMFLFVTITQLIARGYFPHLENQPQLNSLPSHSLNFLVYCLVGIAFSVYLVRVVTNGWNEQHQLALNLQKTSSDLQAALERESTLSKSLRISLDQAQEVNRIREKLIVTVSHEFRTPLSVIMLSANLLHNRYEQLKPTKRQQYFAYINENVAQLEQLIDEIVNWQAPADGEVEQFVQLIRRK